LYEINYGGSTEEIRRYVLFGAMAGGTAKNLQGFAEQCMAEYDLDGWKVPDLVDPDELSYHVIRSASSVSPQIAHEQDGASKTHGGIKRP
jgi:4-hydroxyphenylacetate 3-monooxygenase